jgi:hypothetical protein
MRIPLQQAPPDPSFEASDMLADRGLPQAEPPRRLGKAQRLADRQETLKKDGIEWLHVEGHNHHVS